MTAVRTAPVCLDVTVTVTPGSARLALVEHLADDSRFGLLCRNSRAPRIQRRGQAGFKPVEYGSCSWFPCRDESHLRVGNRRVSGMTQTVYTGVNVRRKFCVTPM